MKNKAMANMVPLNPHGNLCVLINSKKIKVKRRCKNGKQRYEEVRRGKTRYKEVRRVKMENSLHVPPIHKV
jgi:hypothetical protein